MKLARIGTSPDSRTTIIKLNKLKDPEGNAFELPPDPENNLVFDPRAIEDTDEETYAWKFDVKVEGSTHLIITRTDDYDHSLIGDTYFRVYDRTKEYVPPFDSSVPYEYWGLIAERAPTDTTVVKVHHTVTAIKTEGFDVCGYIIKCDMSDAPVEEIEYGAFWGNREMKTILFSQLLKKIEQVAFANCKTIDVIVIPSTVTYIGWEALALCEKMRILKLPDDIDLDNVSDEIIYHCHALLAKVPPNQTPKQWLKHRYDQYPLHKICYNAHVTVEQVQQCIQTHPNAVHLTDEFDMTALHMITIMACTSNLQTPRHNQDEDEGFSTLKGTGHIMTCFDANMSAAFVQDDRSKTPLDYLLKSSDGLDVHTVLVTSLCLHRNASASHHQHHLFKRMRRH